MKGSILVISGDYHFGDSPGIFQGATYVGHRLALPLRKQWINEEAESVAFLLLTHDVETWGQWQGHRVLINDVEIGRIKDSGDTSGQGEQTVITMKRVAFHKLLGGSDQFTLSVELERQVPSPGLSDDFVLTRIDTSADLAVSVGWK